MTRPTDQRINSPAGKQSCCASHPKDAETEAVVKAPAAPTPRREDEPHAAVRSGCCCAPPR